MQTDLSPAHLLGPSGPQIVAGMTAARAWLDAHPPAKLLPQVGTTLTDLPAITPVDKAPLPRAYGGQPASPTDDLLAGRGLFYITEGRRLFLDCTAGHYQMLWGYNPPPLEVAIADATRAGVIWDNHSNIPQAPLKQLAHRLIEIARQPGEPDPLDKVHLGLCTGSVACATALKIQLKVHAQTKRHPAPPVIISLAGNYHGSDMVPQFMRGLWPGFPRPFELVSLPPNDLDALDRTFRTFGERCAGFWAEPVMMNREAIPVSQEYLQHARSWCDHTGALLCLDEIQTGFWRPEIFDFRALGIRPDLVVLGKGMAAGFHPLSGVLFHQRHDVLEQYDAISTNGSAALPALVALASLELIQHRAAVIARTAAAIAATFGQIAAEFPHLIQQAQGRGHLFGLRLQGVEQAKELHRRLLAAGLWTRVHAYHEGHRTLLTKLGLLADEDIVAFVGDRLRRALREMSTTRPVAGGRPGS